MDQYLASTLSSGQRKVRICDVNPHIVCSLCAGYFIDATTITECLHTFCRSCIVKHFQLHKTCPTCNEKVHETQPLLTLKSDRTMQDIVFRLVPNLQREEMRRCEEFYKAHGVTTAGDGHASRSSSNAEVSTHIPVNDESLSLRIERHPEWEEDSRVCKTVKQLYIRCSSHTTLLHVKKYLTQKFSVPPILEVELLCNEIVLHKDYTLKFVWLAQWQKRDPPLVIHYRLRVHVG
ncbi:polycomb group RING finger protein 3-like [Sycon ciliatum]|uniref:polycomb group RING finger protein 3-like n=1 Tax=Sycon ciliatum TaxID=27933 RepID=UPI0020AEC4B5|eukprot:scpid94269/ scgid24957/ Polycomb group RING finger protein 3; RING finger protein 3A